MLPRSNATRAINTCKKAISYVTVDRVIPTNPAVVNLLNHRHTDTCNPIHVE